MPIPLTESQQSIVDLARDFVAKDLNPIVNVLETGDLTCLRQLWQCMAERGLTGLPFPEQYGGAAVDSIAYFAVLEEIAKVSSALATALSVHVSLAGFPLLSAGTQAQKDQYLPDMVLGKKIGAFALTEPNAGSDAGSGITTAVKQPDGSYCLNGSKIFISNALVGHVFLVTARTQANVDGHKGLSAFIVERDLPGLTIAKGDEKMGLLGGDWGELHFDNCVVAESQRLSDEGNGFKLFMNSLNIGRISIAAISTGIARAALDAALQYAKERKQFNQPIADFQAIQFKLADMAVKIEAARSLVFNAAHLKEAGQDFSMEAAMAKYYASEICNQCASEAVQIFGGYGYTKDFPVERYFRDARVMSLFEGTSQIQQLIIAKKLLM